ncbi:MAG: hypothetical protein FWD60_07240 [Candidatus Azobacteroides sp.]|nr:hypothetical protein [Candidatus Azobacteroides sp.]
MKNLLFLFIILCCFACNTNTNTNKNEDLISLYRQRIPNSSMVIYQFSYAGIFVTNSDDNGTVILDSTETFNWKKSREKLPFYIESIDVNSNTINCIELIDFTSSKAKGIYKKKYKDMEMIVKQYSEKKGSDMGLFYKYKSFVECQDSIYFENLTIGCFGLNLRDKMGFPKGQFEAQEDSCGYVTKLSTMVITQYPLWEKMRTQKVGDTIDISDAKTNFKCIQADFPPLSMVYRFYIVFTPENESVKQKISDFGIYKKVKIK